MTEATTDPAQRAAVALLLGNDADRVLEAVLDQTNSRLDSWRRRALHRHGSSGVTAVYEAVVSDAVERRRTMVLAAHHTDRPVPPGGVRTEVDGIAFQTWRFPADPYMPGLVDVVDPDHARSVLRSHGLRVSTVDVHTRRYRPTRRAVIEWRRAGTTEPVLYCKVLGGRTPELVASRTTAIADAHAHLRGAVPVPNVVDVDEVRGTVGLSRLAGTSLRTLLRTGEPLPEPDAVLDVVRRLYALPTFESTTDPRSFSDVSRHVRTLTSLLPDLGDRLETLASVASETGGPEGLVHGDLHDGQLLVMQGVVVGVLDVDGIGTGLIAQDLGRLVANSEAAGLHDPAQAGASSFFAEGLLDAGGELAPEDDIIRGAVGAWVSLATGPHRVQSPAWEADTRRRIEMAEGWASLIG